MSIIPTIDKKTASREAKEYLKQYHDWQLITRRANILGSLFSDKQEQTHQRAVYECNKRLKVIDTIVKGGFELSFYGGLKMYDLGGLGIDRCQTV